MLKARVITALVMVAGLLACIFLLPPAGWLLFGALLCAAGAWEWGAFAGLAGARRVGLTAAFGLACVLLGVAAGLHGDAARTDVLLPLYVLSALFWVFAVPAWLARKWRLSSLWLAIVTGFIVLVPTALALVQLRAAGPWVLLGVMAVVWVADIAAYFSGRAFGRHKLAPSISPGKTWEGAAGAVIAVLVYGFAVLAAGPGLAAFGPLPVALALLAWTALSIIGDLFESLLKRQAGLKDSGSLLPGHGGVLDRVDSLTSTLPLVALVSLWLAR